MRVPSLTSFSGLRIWCCHGCIVGLGCVFDSTLARAFPHDVGVAVKRKRNTNKRVAVTWQCCRVKALEIDPETRLVLPLTYWVPQKHVLCCHWPTGYPWGNLLHFIHSKKILQIEHLERRVAYRGSEASKYYWLLKDIVSGLKVYVPSTIICWDPNPNVMVFGGDEVMRVEPSGTG